MKKIAQQNHKSCDVNGNHTHIKLTKYLDETQILIIIKKNQIET